MKSNNKQNKLHYKMYKSGKKWIIAGIFTITVGTSIMLTDDVVNADTIQSTQNNNSSLSSNSNTNKTSYISSEVKSLSSNSNITEIINKNESNASSTSSAIGNESNASSTSSAIGNESNASSTSSAIGNESNASSTSSAIGNESNVSSISSAIGNESNTSSTSSAIGNGSNASSASNDTGNKSSASITSSAVENESKVSNSLSSVSASGKVVNSDTTKLNDIGSNIKSVAKDIASGTSTPEELMNNTILNQNFHYNVPRGYSNDIQSILPHTNSNGTIDYYDIYYLYNPYPDQHAFADEWYHVRTSDFKTFTPLDSNNPTSTNNVAIPSPDYKDENGNLTQVSSNNKNGIPWGYVATGSVIYNNGLLRNDQWGNKIDTDAKLAYFTSFLPNQEIYLAYSNNDQQFHPYSDKPTITAEDAGLPTSSEFRDPQVVRTNSNDLVSYISGGHTSKMYVMTSNDGINWSHDSSNDIDLSRIANNVEVETPVVQTINNNAFMFFSWHNGDDRSNAVINGDIDNNGLFKLNDSSKVASVDGSPYKSDTYAGNYTNVDPSLLVNVNWSGNWLYSPLGVNNSYKYFTEHGGSFAIPRLIKNDNGQLQYIPIEPNNQLVVSYKTGINGQSTPMIANTNNKLDFSFDSLDTNKTINLKRNASNITISIGDGKINVQRDNSINSSFSKNSSMPLNVSNISKLEMYVDNSSVELYIPESNQFYSIYNISSKQDEPYNMTLNTGATIDNYEFNNNYQSLSTPQIDTVIKNLSSNVNNDSIFSKSLSSIVNSYASVAPQDSDYASLSTMLSTANDKLNYAYNSISVANSYASTASSISNDGRLNLYLVLASSAYVDASNAENYSVQSIMTARNTLATKAPSANEVVNGKQVINGHNVMFIDGKQVNGQIYTDSDGQSHYYDSINGYEGINLFYLNNGKYYYFDKNGNMVKNQFVTAIPHTDYSYYFGNDGVAVNGNQNIDGKNYLFNNGIQVKNTMIINPDSTFSYYDNNGLVTTTPTNINNQNFNFNSDGKLVAPNQFIKNSIFSNATYYLDSNSHISKGFQDINGSKYYFDNNGQMIINTYEMDSNGNFYRFGGDGKALTGKQIVDYTKRYFNSDGVQVKYVAHIDDNDRISFYDGDGNPIDKVNDETGKNVSSDSNDNIIAPDTFVVSPLNNNLIYYLNSDNKVTKGFSKIDGNRYYFDNNGIMLKNGTINDSDGNNYQANSNGILILQNASSSSNSTVSSAASSLSNTASSASLSSNSTVNSATSSLSDTAISASSSSNSIVNSATSSLSSTASSSSSSMSNSVFLSSSSNKIISTNTGTSTTPSISTGGYVATTNTTINASSSSSTNSNSASSRATSSSVSLASNASSASSASSSVLSSSTSSAKSSEPGNDTHKPNDGAITIARVAMAKAQKEVKVAEKNKQQSHSKVHVKNYNKTVANYYQAEKAYLKVAKLYNSHYYYDFDQVTKHSKNVKLKKLAFVYDSKKFTKQNRIHKLKKGTKVKVNKIVRHGKTTRFNIGHDKFITGLKSFIHKLTK